MSAKRPSRRKMVGEPSSCVTCTTSPSSTTVLLPGSVLAGTGVEARNSVQDRSLLRQTHGDLDRVAALAAMRIADRHAAEQRLDGVVDVALLDPEEFEAILVDGYAQAGSRLLDRIVDVDDERHCAEDLLGEIEKSGNTRSQNLCRFSNLRQVTHSSTLNRCPVHRVAMSGSSIKPSQSSTDLFIYTHPAYQYVHFHCLWGSG